MLKLNKIFWVGSIQTDRSRSAQLIVSWETDEPATSKVNFGESGAGVYTSSSRMDQNKEQIT